MKIILKRLKPHNPVVKDLLTAKYRNRVEVSGVKRHKSKHKEVYDSYLDELTINSENTVEYDTHD